MSASTAPQNAVQSPVMVVHDPALAAVQSAGQPVPVPPELEDDALLDEEALLDEVLLDEVLLDDEVLLVAPPDPPVEPPVPWVVVVVPAGPSPPPQATRSAPSTAQGA